LQGTASDVKVGTEKIFLFAASNFRLNCKQIELIQKFLVNIAIERVLSYCMIALKEKQLGCAVTRTRASNSDAGSGGCHESAQAIRVFWILDAWCSA